MKFYVIWRTSLKALLRNRRRSILTMTGIIIGISSVIAIMAIGKGYQKEFMKQLSNDEGENISVRVNFSPNDNSLWESNIDFFQPQDLEQIRTISGVKSVVRPKSEFGEAVGSEKEQVNVSLNIKGKAENKLVELSDSTSLSVTSGRELTKEDDLRHEKIAVIDNHTAKAFYTTTANALDRGIEINGEIFTIVGIYKGAAASIFVPSEPNIYIPRSAYLDYFEKPAIKYQVLVTIQKEFAPNEVMEQVTDVLKNDGTMRESGEYEVLDTTFLTEGMGQVISGLTYFISAIAGISLFIAGVGVMNMMYISVSERTKEIGIRRALGATENSIRIQFLLEGVTITLIGGLIGYLFGILIAYLISLTLPFPIAIDSFTIVLAISVSTIIGLVFSVMPASAAAKKDLIDILR